MSCLYLIKKKNFFYKMNLIRILIALLFTIHLSDCNINNAITTMKHFIDLDRLPYHITK